MVPMADSVTGSETKVFRPERTHIFAAVLITLISLLGIGAEPLKLGWLLLFPLGYIYWTLRARTEVSPTKGISAKYGFRGNQSVSWEDFQGIGFKGGSTFAQRRDGSTFNLPAVTFNSLPELSVASQGRIQDALSEGRAAADEKIVVTYKDGHQVLMSREEYAATHPGEAIPGEAIPGEAVPGESQEQAEDVPQTKPSPLVEPHPDAEPGPETQPQPQPNPRINPQAERKPESQVD